MAALLLIAALAQSDPGWNILPDGRVRWCWYEFHADREILHCILLQEWTIS